MILKHLLLTFVAPTTTVCATNAINPSTCTPKSLNNNKVRLGRKIKINIRYKLSFKLSKN